jgi:ADP-ribosylglycohydrolase
MRIAPLAYTDATDDEVRAVSAITHAHKTSTDACVRLVHIIQAVEAGESLLEAINAEAEYRGWEWMADAPNLAREAVKSGGYVIDTLGAALWCTANTDSYEAAVTEAVKLGSDTDTTACVAGAIAGAMYGYDAIPQGWIEVLRGKEIIEHCLF